MEMTSAMAFDPVVVRYKERVPKRRGRGRFLTSGRVLSSMTDHSAGAIARWRLA